MGKAIRAASHTHTHTSTPAPAPPFLLPAPGLLAATPINRLPAVRGHRDVGRGAQAGGRRLQVQVQRGRRLGVAGRDGGVRLGQLRGACLGGGQHVGGGGGGGGGQGQGGGGGPDSGGGAGDSHGHGAAQQALLRKPGRGEGWGVRRHRGGVSGGVGGRVESKRVDAVGGGGGGVKGGCL